MGGTQLNKASLLCSFYLIKDQLILHLSRQTPTTKMETESEKKNSCPKDIVFHSFWIGIHRIPREFLYFLVCRHAERISVQIEKLTKTITLSTDPPAHFNNNKNCRHFFAPSSAFMRLIKIILWFSKWALFLFLNQPISIWIRSASDNQKQNQLDLYLYFWVISRKTWHFVHEIQCNYTRFTWFRFDQNVCMLIAD